MMSNKYLVSAKKDGSGGAEQAGLINYAKKFSVPYEELKLSEIPSVGLNSADIDPIICDTVDPTITAFWGYITEDDVANEHDEPNNHSLVLRIYFGESSFLFTGDLEEDGINALLARSGDYLDVDVYQVGHHGSKNGTTKDMVKKMKPKVAIFSMGDPDRIEFDWKHKRYIGHAYGHPNKGIIQRIINYGDLLCRDSVNVKVGTRPFNFEQYDLSRAIYGTGWGGDIVVTADETGWLSVDVAPLVSCN